MFRWNASWEYSVSSFTSSLQEAILGPFSLKEVNVNPFPAEKGIGPAYIQGNQAGPFSQKTYPWTKPSTLGGAEGLSRGPASRSRAGVGCAGALDPRASAPQAVRRDRRVGPGRLGPLPWGAPGPPPRRWTWALQIPWRLPGACSRPCARCHGSRAAVGCVVWPCEASRGFVSRPRTKMFFQKMFSRARTFFCRE